MVNTLDPAPFRWHPSPDNAAIMQRKANGVEVWVGNKGLNWEGCYDFYQTAKLRVVDVSDLSLTRIKKALMRGLLDARFANPTISCYGVWGEHEKAHLPMIKYKSFDSQEEAQAWADKIIQIKTTTYNSQDLRADRYQKRQDAAEHVPSNPLDIIVNANVASEDTILAPGTAIDLTCYFNHVTWDGKGRFFCQEIIQRAVEILDNGDDAKFPAYKWGEEVERLDKPILDSMAVGLDELDEGYESAQKEFIEKHDKIGSSWGLKVAKGKGGPNEVRHTLTAGQSKKIQQAVKARMGGKYNDGHLGHAATILVMMDYNPIPEDKKDSATLYSPLPIDGRRYIEESRDTERYGNVQTSAVVEFQRLADWAPKKDEPEGVKVALEKLSKHVKKAYDYWLEKADYHLPMGVTYHNRMADFVAKLPDEVVPDIWAPAFCNDGRVEVLMNHEYAGPATGTTFFETVDSFCGMDMMSFTNTIRMDSWNGQTRLAFNFHDGYLPRETAQAFLGEIARYMVEFSK